MAKIFGFQFQVTPSREHVDERLQMDMMNEKIESIIEEFGFELVGGFLGIEMEEDEEESDE